MQHVKEDGVYISDNISRTSCEPRLFAMANLEWNNKTLQGGGGFHATTAIIIQNPQSDPPQNTPEVTCIPSSTGISRDRILHKVPEVEKSAWHVTANDRLKGGSLSTITSIENLMIESDESAAQLLLVWRIGRLMYASSSRWPLSSKRPPLLVHVGV